LQGIVTLLLKRAKEGHHTTFIKVKSHVGIQGNERGRTTGWRGNR